MSEPAEPGPFPDVLLGHPWRRYADSAAVSARGRPSASQAARTPGPSAFGRSDLAIAQRVERLLDRRAQRRANRAAESRPAPRPWRDLRLVPLAAAVWAGAAWAPFGLGLGLSADATALGAGLGGLGVLAPTASWAAFRAWHARKAGRARSGGRGHRTLQSPATCGVVLLAIAVVAAWAVGYAAASARIAHDAAGPVGALLREGGATTAVLEILAEPHRQRPSGQRPGGEGGEERRYVANARLLEATRDGERFSASVRVIVTGGESLARAKVGEIVEAPAKVRAAAPGDAPFVSLAGSPRHVRTAASAAGPAEAREALRRHAAWLPADASGLVPALATGDRSALEPRLEEDMRAAGLGHLTAVSGANFAIVLGSAALALRLARCPRWAVVFGCALTLVAFVGVVGPEPSVLRAAVMGTVALLALATGRAGASCSALCGAVVVILLADPALALSLGFLLSVLATLGIALVAPRLAAALGAYLPEWLSLAIAVPLSAQLLCGPALVFVQPQFQTWSLAANIVAAPLVPIITVASTLALATGSVAPPVAWLALAVGGPPAELLAIVAHTTAALPGAGLPWPEGPLGAIGMALVSALTGPALLAGGDPRVRRGAAALRDTALRLATGRPRGKVDG